MIQQLVDPMFFTIFLRDLEVIIIISYLVVQVSTNHVSYAYNHLVQKEEGNNIEYFKYVV